MNKLEGPALRRFADAFRDGVTYADLKERFGLTFTDIDRLRRKLKLPQRPKSRRKS